MTKSTDKREQVLIEKYGSEEALKAKRQEWQAKSREKYSGNGGFRALEKSKLIEIAKLGAKKRWEKKDEQQG